MKTKLHTKSTRKVLAKCTASPDRHANPLTDGQRERFCQAILSERSATGAAIKAGYAPGCAKVTAARLMKNRDVQARIAYLLSTAADRRVMRKRDILVLASQRARTTFADVIGFFGMTEDEIKEKLVGHPAAPAIREVKCLPDSKGVMRVMDIKLYDPRDSYRDLAEFLGWSEPDKVQVSGQVGIVYLPTPKRVTPDARMEATSGSADSSARD